MGLKKVNKKKWNRVKKTVKNGKKRKKQNDVNMWSSDINANVEQVYERMEKRKYGK